MPEMSLNSREIIEWLESYEGERWSRSVNGRTSAFRDSLLSVKEDLYGGPSPEAMSVAGISYRERASLFPGY